MERTTSYTDAAGRTWDVRIDVLAIDRIADRTGVDLLACGDEDVLSVGGNQRRLVRMLHAAVSPESPYPQFAGAHLADVLEAAEAAFTEAVIRFFPLRRQAILRAIRERQERAVEQVLAAIEQGLRDGRIDRKLQQAVFAALPPELREIVREPSDDGSGEPPAF